MSRPIVALEEHFCYSAELIDNGESGNPYTGLVKAMPGLRDRLLDIGPLRLSAMDQVNCTFQVVSHAPVLPALDAKQCQAANNALSHHIQSHPDRFGGFALLPVADAAACVDELARCVKNLGFAGALIDSHTEGGDYFDSDEYLPLFQAAQALDVPIYLHPTWPTKSIVGAQFEGNFPAMATSLIGSSTFGWHADVAIHLIRLFASGLFDKVPQLKLIVGHMGEMIPYMLERIIATSSWWGMERDFGTVWAENIWVTTSGNWSIAPLACMLRNTPVEHIMLSIDYPFVGCSTARDLLTTLEGSELVNSQQLDAIAFGNASKLLKRHLRVGTTHTVS